MAPSFGSEVEIGPETGDDILASLGTSLEEEEAFSFVRDGHVNFLNSLSPPHNPKKKEVLPETFLLRQPVLPPIPESDDEGYDSSSSQSSANEEPQKPQQSRRKRQG